MQKSTSKSQPPSSGPAFSVHDVLYVLFKHKRKIVLFSLLGFAVATVLYLKQEPIYKSESKLLIRYVLAKGMVDPFEAMSAPGGGVRGRGDSVINTEIEILKSVDLSLNVAAAVGAKKLLPAAEEEPSVEEAAAAVRKGLEVLPGQSSSVLYVNYGHKDPQLSKDVLAQLLDRYFKRHLEIHRSAAAFDLVAKQADEAKAVLREKEMALDQLRTETGIMTLADATAALTAQKSKTQEDLLKARAERAERLASIASMEKGSNPEALNASNEVPGGKPQEAGNAPAMSVPSSGVVTEYRSVTELIGFLQKRDLELRVKFKPGNRLIALNRDQLATNEARRTALETQYPSLTAQVMDASAPDAGNPQAQWIAAKAGLAAVEAKIGMLNDQLKEISEQFVHEYVVGAKVEELKRERDILDSEYRTLETKLKSAKIETTLDPSHMPNITIVQQPTAPIKTIDEKMQKVILGIAGSGVCFGIGLAFLIELLFNRKISRPIEIQTRLQLPLMLSIPYLNGRARGRFITAPAADIPLIAGGEGTELRVASGEAGGAPLARSEHFILPYAETLRDRIIFNFEINNVLHKPKFVAVAGLSEGAGASTIAAGLAKSFSEINGAKVLLVDLSSLHPEQNPIFGEVPLLSLSGALELNAKKNKDSEENLYYASALARRDDTGLSSFTPIQLYELMPRLQASAYDYIVFDMPAIDETSRTLAMAGLMDKVLLVLDAENTSRDALKWGYSELVKGKADVSCIFNKTRSVAPGWLLGDN